MQHRETKPSHSIANHVECYWQVNRTAETRQADLLLIPEGTSDIVFCDQAITLEFDGEMGAVSSLPPGGWIIGQKTQCCRLTLPTGASVFGIRIKPHAISCFTPVSPKEFRNSYLPLNVLAFSRYAASIERLSTDGVFARRVTVAEALIAGILADAPPFSSFTRAHINYVLDRRGNLRLADLRKHFEISRPALCSRFLDQVGLLPKELTKIWRMNHFLLLQAQHPNLNHTEISLHAGYYDQPHLIKDFTTLFNQSPSRYFKQDNRPFGFYAKSVERRFNDEYPAVG